MNIVKRTPVIHLAGIIRISLTALFIVFVGFSARGGEPTDQVKATTEQILSVLRDPKWTSPSQHKEQVDTIQKLISERFDWEAISQGCLGRHWRDRSAAEKREFQSLLENFLRRNYVDKITSSYTNLVEVRYLNEKVIDISASVQTKVVTQKTEASVEYRLRKKSAASGWKVYDALIEGVSLVKNYRVQFDEIINSSSFEKLVARIKKRIEEAADPDVPL